MKAPGRDPGLRPWWGEKTRFLFSGCAEVWKLGVFRYKVWLDAASRTRGTMRPPGFVKLWRKTLDSGLVQHPNALQLFIWLLLKAAWKPTRYATRWGVIDLKPGQVIVSRSKLASELETGEQTIRTAMKLLKKMEILTSEVTSELTRITIVKWEEYQLGKEELTSILTSTQPAPNQHLTTEEELKEVKELKKKPIPANAGEFEQFWTAYPKKKSKGAARKAWLKERPSLAACLATLSWQKRSEDWTKDNGKFIPYPGKWLSEQRWLDEQESGRGSGRGTGGPIALGDVGFGGRPDIDF